MNTIGSTAVPRHRTLWENLAETTGGLCGSQCPSASVRGNSGKLRKDLLRALRPSVEHRTMLLAACLSAASGFGAVASTF